MSVDILVPADRWEGDEEAVLSRWLYRDGDRLEAGVVVCELMVEKISFEIPAPVGGVLSVSVGEETPVTKGMKLGSIA